MTRALTKRGDSSEKEPAKIPDRIYEKGGAVPDDTGSSDGKKPQKGASAFAAIGAAAGRLGSALKNRINTINEKKAARAAAKSSPADYSDDADYYESLSGRNYDSDSGNGYLTTLTQNPVSTVRPSSGIDSMSSRRPDA